MALLSDYRIMQSSRNCFYIEQYRANWLGFNPKWRPMKQSGYGGMEYVLTFPAAWRARNYVNDLKEFRDGPRVVDV
jgi:hypothetical protein